MTTSTDRRLGINSSAAIKVPCVVATTANITLSGTQTIDGVAVVADDRVLVKDQTVSSENGIYDVDSSSWSRAKDWDGSLDVKTGTLVFVNSGTVGQGFWYVSTTGTIIPGTTNVTLGRASSVLAVTSAFMQTVLDDTSGAAALATLGALGLVGGTLTGVLTFAATNPANNLLTGICDGRLTLTTAVPVTTTDVTAATTLYFCPYAGNRIALYDGSATWKMYTFTELSIAVPATTSQMYDVFVYDNSGTPTLELTAWTNDTTRATALTTQNSVLVKTGATTRRYIGSFRTTAVSGQTEDSVAKRYVWNYYNRKARPMRVLESTNSWAYTTAAFRQANAATSNQLDFIVGVSEDQVRAELGASVVNDAGNITVQIGIGLDSTTALATDCINGGVGNTYSANVNVSLNALYLGYPGVGRHYLSWLEYSQAGSGTTTWIGDNGGTIAKSGIQGTING